MLELIKKHLRKAFSFSEKDVQRQLMLTNLRIALEREKLERHKDFIKSISNEELEQLTLLAQYGANIDEMISCYKENKDKGITFLMLRNAQILAMDLEEGIKLHNQKLKELPKLKP